MRYFLATQMKVPCAGCHVVCNERMAYTISFEIFRFIDFPMNGDFDTR
jgi:hypothetical protein